ncbi:hypothetical protein V494_07951 [Pseudogymnoascus sp. VKM F-4513 (FW-928)]|nr:hypothetical protein V494_07951 [Pseudogymnoascus sp. VKM F-4513 (FW-928)]
MDVFSGVLSGSAFAGGVTGPYDPSKPADVGHFLVAIKPDLFMDLEAFKERMDTLYQKVVGSEKMAGVDRIFFPGEIEQDTMEKRLADGIPFVQAEIDALNAEAALVGVERHTVGATQGRNYKRVTRLPNIQTTKTYQTFYHSKCKELRGILAFKARLSQSLPSNPAQDSDRSAASPGCKNTANMRCFSIPIPNSTLTLPAAAVGHFCGDFGQEN